ncbi:MAG: DMT family transporter [Rhodospirillales bacterium]|jgi:drug/metabolite transporter (DMT)-like permease|nr:DMT family transporter [Rhodospirillales bacterium]
MVKPGPAPDNPRGIVWMLASVAAFTVMGLIIKDVTSQVSLAVVVLFRQWVVLLILVPWLVRAEAREIRTRRLGTHAFRALMALSSFACLAYAVSRLTLADAIALAYTNPLWSILVSVIFLGEAVRIRRWTATVVGFVGVLCIVRPAGQIDSAMLVALASAVCASLSMMMVKKLTSTESPHQILFYFTLVGSLVSLGPGLYYWQTPSLGQGIWLVIIGVMAFLGQICLARAIALADVTLVAPVDFLRLPLAAVFGLVLFAEIPDAWTLAGGAIIALASAYIVRREAVLRLPDKGG